MVEFKYKDFVRNVKSRVKGKVIGGYIKTDGRMCISVERPDGAVFHSKVDELEHVNDPKQECKHNEGFRTKLQQKGHNHFTCNLGCGYSLNFNPDNFEDTITYYERELSKEDPVHNF